MGEGIINIRIFISYSCVRVPMELFQVSVVCMVVLCIKAKGGR